MLKGKFRIYILVSTNAYEVLASSAIILAKAVCFYYISVLGGNRGKEQKKKFFVRLWKNSYFQCNRGKHSKLDSSSFEGCSRSDFMRFIFLKIIALEFVPCHVIVFTCTSGSFNIYLLSL